MDLAIYAVASATLIGLVNGVKLAVNKNWVGFSLFAVSVIAGLIFGMLHWFGLPSPEIGLTLGLAASGTYEVSQRVGGH